MGEGCADGNEDNVIEFQAALLLRPLVEKIYYLETTNWYQKILLKYCKNYQHTDSNQHCVA